MRMLLVPLWWLLSAVAVYSSCFTLPALDNFLQGLNPLGLGFKVLPPMCTIARRDKNTTIACQPIETEQGVANVTWVKNTLVVNDKRRYVLPNGTLFISNVEDSDRGIYRCVLTKGMFSVTSAFAYLRFPVTGVWQIKPQNNTVEKGRAVRLTCLMASLPKASYIWLKDGNTLPENETRYYQPNPGVLQITKVNFQDQGMFKCKAVNELLKEEFHSSGGYLRVVPHEDDKGASFQHTLIGVPSKVEVHEGEKAVLECITNDEDPILEWSRIDEAPIMENTTIRQGQGQTWSLVFPAVTEQDTGVYNCTAVSKKSRDPSRTQMITLTMMTKPRVQLSMTIANRPTPLDSKISNGQSVRITCATWGTPAPSISWYKNGILHITSARHKLTSQNSSYAYSTEDLYIGNVMFKDKGVYQCVTRNRAGVASDGFILKINTSNYLPKPPINIRALEVTPYSINLSWTPPTDSNVSGYIVNYLVEKSQEELQIITNRTLALIKELRPSINYVFYIRSFLIKNDSIFGEPSNFVTIKTKDDCPTTMPVVKLYPKSPTELYANWTLVKCKNKSPIIEQKIQWKKKKKHYHIEKSLLPNVTECTIYKLQPNKAYKVRVLVSTSTGYPLHMIQLDWYTIRMPRNNSVMPHVNPLLTVHLSTCSQRPTEILANWTLDASLQKDLISYRVFCNASTSSWQHEQPATDTSRTFTNLDPETCYGVKVQATLQNRRSSTYSHIKTICTLSQRPSLSSEHTNTNKMKVKKLKTKVLNTTSVLITWKHTPRKMLVDFYTIKVENIKSRLVSHARRTEGIHSDEANEMDLETNENGTHNPQPTQHEEVLDVTDAPGGEVKTPHRNQISLYRVTNQRLIVTNLRPLHNYSVTVTASTTSLTGHPTSTFVTPDEGVPTPPLNVTWVPASPKDAILTWSPPRLVNGHLLSYLVAFSHDEQEWRNQTIAKDRTTTQIQDLVSNTNYTLHISGVTGKGVGAPTTVFIYIRATLESEPHITTELTVISVVSLLVAVTCVVAVLLCLRMLRLRNNSPSVFQGNGTCRMMYANGVKSSGRDHGTEPDDYKPMLASLPPATQNHHLDTKGGPGSHDDGIVANSLFDPSAIQMNQDDGTSEGMEPLRDGLANHRMLDTLDDIDDADDGSRRLLQSVSTAQPVFSKNMKEFNPRSMYNSTQVDHHSSTDGAVVEPTDSS